AFPQIAEPDFRDEIQFDERLVAPVDHSYGKRRRGNDIALVSAGPGCKLLEHDAPRASVRAGNNIEQPFFERFAAGAARVGFDIAGGKDFLPRQDRKSTRLNSSHVKISYAVFCLKKKK